MKWRLLAGQGEALYEIGVSDAGILVGLTRTELDESLSTLERMAGELGATVIIQKEITIPAASGLDAHSLNKVAHTQKSLGITGQLGTPLGSSSGYSSDGTNLRDDGYKTIMAESLFLDVKDENTAIIERSAPRPIIRTFPYGQGPRSEFRPCTFPPESKKSFTHSRSYTKYSTVETTDGLDEVDDDAAFAFDLDINSFALFPSPFSPSISPNPLPSQPVHQLKKKKPLAISMPVDPQAKAIERRIRRDERREEKRRAMMKTGFNGTLSTVAGRTSGNTVAMKPEKPRSSFATKSRPSNALNASIGPDCEKNTQDAILAPRYIAEAVVLRKAVLEDADTVNVELDLSTLDLGMDY